MVAKSKMPALLAILALPLVLFRSPAGAPTPGAPGPTQPQAVQPPNATRFPEMRWRGIG